MATLGAALARCLNDKTEIREGMDRCPKCGDPVAINPRARAQAIVHSTAPGILGEMEVALAKRGLDASGEPAGVALSDEQRDALNSIQGWFLGGASRYGGSGQPVFRLFGAAGTGKTTLTKHLAAALGVNNIVYGAYTGKAAHVLRSKGVPATTIHSAVYCPVDNKEARARHRVVMSEIAELRSLDATPTTNGSAWAARMAELEAELAQLEEALKHGVEFELNPASEWADADLIVLDEVSMVNEQIGRDIESFGVPILVLGDPYQLPPVEGGGYWTRQNPDVILREVHRFYLDSPVGALATDIRTMSTDGLDLLKREKVNLEAAMAADQILCWKNATRHNLTSTIREKKGRPAGTPVPGDRVMCLVNNKDLGIFNGQQFEVLEVEGADAFLLRDDEGRKSIHYYDPDGFRGADGEQAAKGRFRHQGRVGLFTFAEVITVHKAQGSEWNHVYVVDQTHQMWKSTDSEKRRWLYTACTRASERVTLASTEAGRG